MCCYDVYWHHFRWLAVSAVVGPVPACDTSELSLIDVPYATLCTAGLFEVCCSGVLYTGLLLQVGVELLTGPDPGLARLTALEATQGTGHWGAQGAQAGLALLAPGVTALAATAAVGLTAGAEAAAEVGNTERAAEAGIEAATVHLLGPKRR